jgi:hypothetical protein
MDDVRRALLATPTEARAVLRQAVTVSTRILAQRVKQAAPQDTGALREAITEQAPKGRSLNGFVAVAPGTFRGRVPSAYILPLEYGNGPGARPFIRTTAEREFGAFVSRIESAGKTLERNLEAVGGRNL